MSVVVDVKNLSKTYRTPFSRRLVHAVRGISFSVNQGDSFGFLGPNGAGKTTTIRMLMGLINPTQGSATLFGHKVGERQATMRLGFLPESPYFYEYLSVAELTDLAGRIFGLSRKERAKRSQRLIELVGLKHAVESPLKSYSKGMLQRAGIAQALMNDPELVILDEPMSGLDPIGRKEVREIILALREEGKTVFFSSHILADVEMLAQRVAFVAKGKVRESGLLADFVADQSDSTSISLQCADASSATLLRDKISALQSDVSKSSNTKCERKDAALVCQVAEESMVRKIIEQSFALGAKVSEVRKKSASLEDVFMRVTREAEAS